MTFVSVTRLVLCCGVGCCSTSLFIACASSIDGKKQRNIDVAAPLSQPEAPEGEDSAEQPRVGKQERQIRPAPDVDALPEGPCRRAVLCEDVQILFGPGLMFEGNELCFLDDASQCACGRQLGVDEGDACYGY